GAGVLHIKAKEGATVKVGAVVGTIEPDGKAAATPSPKEKPPQDKPPPKEAQAEKPPRAEQPPKPQLSEREHEEKKETAEQPLTATDKVDVVQTRDKILDELQPEVPEERRR